MAERRETNMAGRPKKPEAELKTNCLYVMMTDGDRAILDAAAKGEGEETSTWARRLLLANAKGRVDEGTQPENPRQRRAKGKTT
jgi:hypothetical protein